MEITIIMKFTYWNNKKKLQIPKSQQSVIFIQCEPEQLKCRIFCFTLTWLHCLWRRVSFITGFLCCCHFFLLCSRCIFLKIILLFAPNKLPVNDWMSQETSAMPLLLNAIKIHACNNASSWMCYDFVLPFATKTPLTQQPLILSLCWYAF